MSARVKQHEDSRRCMHDADLRNLPSNARWALGTRYYISPHGDATFTSRVTIISFCKHFCLAYHYLVYIFEAFLPLLRNSAMYRRQVDGRWMMTLFYLHYHAMSLLCRHIRMTDEPKDEICAS